jgi:hypothetical protein
VEKEGIIGRGNLPTDPDAFREWCDYLSKNSIILQSFSLNVKL